MPFSHWIMHNDSEFSLCAQNVSQVKCGATAVLWTVKIDDTIASCWMLSTKHCKWNGFGCRDGKMYILSEISCVAHFPFSILPGTNSIFLPFPFESHYIILGSVGFFSLHIKFKNLREANCRCVEFRFLVIGFLCWEMNGRTVTLPTRT